MQNRVFGTDGVRGRVGGPVINAEFALRLGHAAGRVLAHGDAPLGARPQVLIGKDTRLSGYMLESALQAGFSSAGVDVVLAGPLPTPAIAYLVRALRLQAGVVISASHNPYEDNGIKFFGPTGMKLPDAVEMRIEEALLAPASCVASADLGRARRLDDAAGRYIEFCKSTFPSQLDLGGLHLVVDAAHGAAYHIAAPVFRELGASVSCIGCEPDGLNINDGVGATHPQALAREVLARGADLGIALDGDADRLQVVDASGRIYNGDELLYAILRERLQRAPVQGVVGTLMTNFALERRLSELGVGFERAAVGDRYVLERMQALGWRYGGESSGHLLCLDCHTTGDGLVAALQVLAALRQADQPLDQWIADLVLYPQILVNVPIEPGTDWRQNTRLREAQLQVQRELGSRGRVLIRASGTEAKLRLMVEHVDPTTAEHCVRRLADAVQSAAT
ncbi:phosphoglucosamine mutase [Verticiella sediminum]